MIITERRSIQAEIRAVEGRRISGYAVVYNALSEYIVQTRAGQNLRFRESIAPGAFSESLANSDIFAFWNHNLDIPLGSRSAGNLVIAEDAKGLPFTLDLDNTQWSDFVLSKVQNRTVQHMSFSFTVPGGGDSWRTEGGDKIRTVNQGNLLEISPVPFPAYTQTSVEARSLEEVLTRYLAETSAAGEAEKAGADINVLLALNTHRRRFA